MRTRFKLIVSFLVLMLILADAYAITRFTWQAPVSLRVGELTSRSADISLRCNPSMIVYGETTSISGQLHNATSNVGVAYQTVSLCYRFSFETSWIYITSVPTAFDGSFSYYWWGSSSLAVGSYVVNATFAGNSEFDQWSSRTDLRVVVAPPPPTLVSPGSSSSPGEEIFTLTPTFTWNSVPSADEYGLYIRDMNSNTLIFDSQARGRTITGTSYTLLPGILQWGGNYRWNMNSHSEAGWGEFCSPLYYHTAREPPKFGIGNWVRTTTNLNVRESPGLSYTIIDTMPLGTIGQILGGPVGADGFVWWDVDYTGGVRGWSVDNWLELHVIGAPTCVVELEKDGVEITEVGVWEFFDIYVGNSTGDAGIKQVRFSSDNVKDGYPTGRWTDWFDWDISSEDWYATTKTKRWAFDTPGYKEVWAEVQDEADQTAFGFATIFVPAPALPVLTSPLVITPVKDIYDEGDSLEAEFNITNIGDVPITLDVLTVAGRLNGFIPPDGPPDFTLRAVTLQPNEPYEYQGSFTLTQMGNYRFFVAYYIEDPTIDERRLLDESNWSTCVELGEGLTHTDRIRNILVYEEGTTPEEVSELSRQINHLTNMKKQDPAYLIDPKAGSIMGSVWTEVSSIWTNVQEEYDELWQAAVEHDVMSRIEVYYARKSLDRGDISSAKEHVHNSLVNSQVSDIYFGAAAQVYDHNLEDAVVAVKTALDRIALGLMLLNPAAGKFASYVFMIPKFIAEVELVGMDRATQRMVSDLVFKFLFSEVANPELGGRTVQNYLNNRVGKLTFPMLQGIFKNNEALQFKLSQALKSIVTWETGWLSKKILDELSKQFPSSDLKEYSPVEIRVHDSEGRITGVINGSVRHEISRSFYRNGTLTIFFPSDYFIFEVSGVEEGTYGLNLTHAEDWNITCFVATGIPTSPDATHKYTVDWEALSVGEKGVTVLVDADGDHVVDRIFSSDSELTGEEFIEKTSPTYPTHALAISAGENGTTFPPMGTYACTANSSVQIKAISDEGYALDYWELDSFNVGSNNPYTVLMEENHTLNAVFRLGVYDVAVTNVLPPKTIIGEGYNLNTNITVANLGDFTEIFNITLYANATAIQTIEIMLTSGTSTTITFPWNTTDCTLGNYTLWAHAEPVPGETYTLDNTFVYGWVFVTILGDVNGDTVVDVFDLSIVGQAYGCFHWMPCYNPCADITEDRLVDARDLAVVTLHYGESNS